MNIKSFKKKVIFCTTILIVCVSAVFGQQNDKQKVIDVLRNVSENYSKPGSLSFDIIYRYANELQPGISLDSLKGSFKINGDQYWYSLDNTEAMGNKEYIMMLFKEDQIMYLTKPSAASITQNPVALIDSVLMYNDSIHVQLTAAQKQKKIKIDFVPGMKYKTIEYEINSSGYISKMKCVVQASELYDPSVKEMVETENVYAIVEAVFTNYKKSDLPNNQFDVTKYFRKEGDEFIALPPYDNYKVFLGTINL
jgi:hypothetical protein